VSNKKNSKGCSCCLREWPFATQCEDIKASTSTTGKLFLECQTCGEFEYGFIFYCPYCGRALEQEEDKNWQR
jgi:hypothetical protein